MRISAAVNCFTSAKHRSILAFRVLIQKSAIPTYFWPMRRALYPILFPITGERTMSRIQISAYVLSCDFRTETSGSCFERYCSHSFTGAGSVFHIRKNAGKEWLPVLNKIPDIYFYLLYGIWFVYLKFVNRKSDWFFSLLVSYLWFVWLKGPFWKMSFPVFLIFQIIWEKQRKDTGIEIVLFLFMDSEEIQFFSIVIMRRYFIAKWMDFFWIAIEYKHFPCIVNSWN